MLKAEDPEEANKIIMELIAIIEDVGETNPTLLVQEDGRYEAPFVEAVKMHAPKIFEAGLKYRKDL